ncbi:protein tyrosine kinase domain containing protein [Entamoeba histolytica HM-1:IMSS-B]|nr:protein tyrosine kinase domain containing protein [Entamoeba histolytica KU27]EMH77585.1 protein tyrosine kinase domain containing protein [Entamoeba histolytica HM-1:IMSS-B]EMS11148.1 protein tyrosine kinase domain containing protein [Entamoeba histolytica HM-3:IMSS]GAT91693.1 protein tyrosine kinase domain-containing protein [Entamoeba histolytica]
MTLWVFFFIYIYFSFAQNMIQCSDGCKQHNCITNFTCLSKCSFGYEEGDTSCLHCSSIDPTNYVTPVYLKTKEGCVSTAPLRQKKTWIPDPSSIPELFVNNNTVYFTFDKTTKIDQSPCYYKHSYRQGKWFKFDSTKINPSVDFVSISLSKNSLSDFNIYLDVSNSDSTDKNPFCLAHFFLRGISYNNRVKIPITFYSKNKEKMMYIFISVDGFESFNAGIRIYKDPGNTLMMYYNLNQTDTDLLRSNLASSLTYTFPFEEYGMYGYGICAPNIIVSYISFTLNFRGNYSIQIYTKDQNRLLYLQEYRIKAEHGESIEKAPATCKTLWIGQEHGVLSKQGTKMGLNIKIDPNEEGDNDTRYFAIMTQEMKLTSIVTIRAICPENCNSKTNNGVCSVEKGKCVCNEKYGGDDCHLTCSYKGQWQVNNYTEMCWFGTEHCNQYCNCESGYTLVDHICVSNDCINGRIGNDEECKQGTEGCTKNCFCEDGYYVSINKKGCKPISCGNGVINDVYNGKGDFVRKEECDGGVNCNKYCYCINGFEPDPNHIGSCKEKRFPVWAYVLIVLFSFAILFIIISSLIIFIVFIMNYKQIDTNTFKEQQPVYYYYINGSVKTQPAKENRYDINPLELDFGNTEDVTAIFDTRFEKITIKNYSNNKWLLVIFHTPNNPKYVFHFEPQVVLVRPHLGSKEITVYMTLFCTTKIRDMKIPYTVWFSKSKSSLIMLSDLLKNKTFETWTQDDQIQMDLIFKTIQRHYHHNLTITTDAASSTHIDIDEIQIADEPVAEGAMGKVFLGSYRSVPVAVKQFRWENLSMDEMDELKQAAMSECELMSKLRNPFIANYMGSVTYIPQVSMVMQYFQLGSLGEYLRKENEDFFVIPYRLKLRVLFDTAKGMAFLHENRIMHLDLKPDNLLVNSFYFDSACCIKITDFGTSRLTMKSSKNLEEKGLGTPIYAAPEANHDEYTFAGDVYSFAVTAWEIFYQEEPYKNFKSLFEIKDYVDSGKRLEFDEKIPTDYKNLINLCWKQNANECPSFDQVCKMLVQINQKVCGHAEMDNEVSNDKIEEIINKRNGNLQRLLNEIVHD